MLGENLKRIAKIKGKKIEAISRFDHEEVLSIERKLNIISDFKKLNINFDKIVEINEKTLSSLKEEQADFLRLIVEFLTLYKTFLFHWEKFLKNRFSENSEEYKKFRMATNIEYDNYFSYRFINELRNYIQHCGYPNITYDATLLDDDTPTYSLTLHSIEIIEDFDWKPIVLDELRKLKKINLLVVMSETVNSLYRINNVALNMCFDIKELFDNLNSIIELKELVVETDENIAVIEFKNFKEGKFDGLGLKVIEFNYLEKVLDNIEVTIIR